MRFPRLLTLTEGRMRRRAVATVAALGAVSAIGTVDSATGSALSFAVFYVLVVVAATVLAGELVGTLAALWSAVLWGLADAATGRSEASATVYIWNGATRFAVHAIIVALVTALLRALRAARESEAKSREFLATAAHQLRTPVAALSASVETLLLDDLSPTGERLLANVAGETSRLGRLVTALLRTARLDQGEPSRLVRVDLAEVCESEVSRFRQVSVVEWSLDVASDVPKTVLLDADATAEALGNVLDNARRHAASLVAVRLYRRSEALVIEVSDDGPGLPSGHESQAFERFVTLDGQGGTGLGLGIARDLARRQGGDLHYEQKTFILTVPLRTARDIPATARERRVVASMLGQDRGGGRTT